MKVFRNKRFNLDIPCDTTITGSCQYGKNLEECIALCKPNENCFWGYFDTKTGMCVPVNADAYKGLNPAYTIQSDDEKVVFINTKKFTVPPAKHRCIFMYDVVKIIENQSNVIFEPTVILISPKPYSRRPKNYIPMTLGEPFLIFDKSNDRILAPLEETVTWNKSLKYVHEDYEEFILEPVSGSNLCYNNLFRIRTHYYAYLYYSPNSVELNRKEAKLSNLNLGSFWNSSIFRLEKTEYIPEIF